MADPSPAGPPAFGRQTAARVGARLGPYTITSILGEGGMGAVYRARDEALGRDVALKVLPTHGSDDRHRRALRELEAASRVRHPNIVTVHAAGEAPGGLFLAMDLVDGQPLDRLLAKGPLEPRRAVELVVGVARALMALHAAGIIHRDVKPGNVLVGADDTPRLADFGVARVLDGEPLTRTHQLLGTPLYMPLEQLEGLPVDERADVYAVGAVLFEALTGQVPAPGETLVALVDAKALRPPPPSRLRPGVPQELDAVCAAALGPKPEERYASMRAFADDLQRWLEGRAVVAPAASRSLALRALPGALAAAGVVALAAVLARPPGDAPAPPATEAPRRTPRTSPPPEPPLKEPDWLRGLRRRGDLPALQSALAALATAAPLEERTREEAVAELERLDAAWVEPEDLGDVDELDRLLAIHLVWQGLDAQHRLEPRHRETLRRGIAAWGLTRRGDPERLTHVGRSLTRLAPDFVDGYVLYEASTRDDPAALPERRGLLRAGLEAARAAGDARAAGSLLRRYGDDLLRVGDEPASAELRALARTLREQAAPPEGTEHILVMAVPLVAREEGLAFLDRAEVINGESIVIQLQRHDLLLRRATPVTVDERQAATWAAERALALLESQTTHYVGDIVHAASAVARARAEAGAHAAAVEALDRGLALGRENPKMAGLALRRLLALEAAGADDGALRAALHDLLARVRRWLSAHVPTPGDGQDRVEQLALKLTGDPRAALATLAGRAEDLALILDR